MVRIFRENARSCPLVDPLRANRRWRCPPLPPSAPAPGTAGRPRRRQGRQPGAGLMRPPTVSTGAWRWGIAGLGGAGAPPLRNRVLELRLQAVGGRQAPRLVLARRGGERGPVAADAAELEPPHRRRDAPPLGEQSRPLVETARADIGEGAVVGVGVGAAEATRDRGVRRRRARGGRTPRWPRRSTAAPPAAPRGRAARRDRRQPPPADSERAERRSPPRTAPEGPRAGTPAPSPGTCPADPNPPHAVGRQATDARLRCPSPRVPDCAPISRTAAEA